ncbi:MAG: hypothetical protein KDI51_13620 [Xanthomonadales bacterium]|nr:hypothetical protein [Xanthomonadales bacterium]
MASPSPAVELSVRDARTGRWLDAQVRFQEGESIGSMLQIAAERPTQLPLSGVVQIEAAGYRGLDLHLAADAWPTTVWLEPLQVPTAAPGWLNGHVYDPQLHRPVAGARLRIGNRTTLSDAEGRFVFDHPPPDLNVAQMMHLHIDTDRQSESRTVLLGPEPSQQLIDLGQVADIDHRQLSRQIADSFDRDPQKIASAAEPPRAPVLAPPASIRVGFASDGGTCCVGSCSTVQVLPLETYVRRGLNDEWIASWTADSLRAGAIAYRSYGAWHVLNPRTAQYDICSSACCQVNDADTSGSSDAAVDATAGLLLTTGSTPFRSEYSAESNGWDDPDDGLPCSNPDLSCGNGAVGSPAADWPCLADAVATDRGCFGHGRGMSQWGSQRWSQQGQRWPWIVAHYYNDNGNQSGAGTGLRTAELTSALQINDLLPLATATAGSLISLQLQIDNLAHQAYDPVYLGASLYSVATGFVSDPPNDLGVRLEPGPGSSQRSFQLPPDLPSGSYDVLVSLYLDIDGNNAINAGDLSLQLARFDDALQVVGAADALFSNGFEAPP